jgi:hypothetical protein
MSTLPKPDAPKEPEWHKPQMFYGKPLTFNEKRHMYFWDGKHVPSVTTIISRLNKPLLIQWAANCAVEHIVQGIGAKEGAVPLPQLLEEARKAHLTKKEDAADIGTAVHKYAQAALTGKPEPRDLPPGAIEACAAFWKWVEQHRIEPVAVERRVMSREHMYAGTCDFYGYIDDRLSVLDFKTGNGIYDEAWWQTSGYSEALIEEHTDYQNHRVLIDIPIRWIVHLNKTTGQCEVYCRESFDDWNQDRNVWLSLLALDKALRIARKHPQPAKRKAA